MSAWSTRLDHLSFLLMSVIARAFLSQVGAIIERQLHFRL